MNVGLSTLRCDACGFAASDYDRQDTAGTVRAMPARWAWTLEGVSESQLATRGAAGMSALDHFETYRQEDSLHAGEHHLHAAGRVLHEIGAGVPTAVGVVERINSSDGGVPKRPVPSALVAVRGIVGDRQATRKHHGRPWQALSLWSREVIDQLVGEGHPIGPGLAGENLTVGGFDWSSLRPGALIALGDVTVMVTAWADPCSSLKRWFTGGEFRRVQHDRHPGSSRAYASVLRPGTVKVGDSVTVEPC